MNKNGLRSLSKRIKECEAEIELRRSQASESLSQLRKDLYSPSVLFTGILGSALIGFFLLRKPHKTFKRAFKRNIQRSSLPPSISEFRHRFAKIMDILAIGISVFASFRRFSKNKK